MCGVPSLLLSGVPDSSRAGNHNESRRGPLMQVGQSFIGASFQRRSMREWFTTGAAADLDILPIVATVGRPVARSCSQ